MNRETDFENVSPSWLAIQGCKDDGTVFFWNRASEMLYGYSAVEAEGKTLGELIIPGKERDYYSRFLEEGRTAGNPGEFLPPGEFTLRTKAGVPVPVRTTHLAVPVGGGEVLLFRFDLELPGAGGLGFGDSTRIERALQESEERFHTVFDAAHDAIYIETPDGRILAVNQSVCDMLGYTRDELLRMRVSDIIPPDRASVLPEVIRRESARRGAYIETENLRKDGSRIPVEISNTVVSLDGEERVIAIVRDISRRKRAEEELKRMDEQLR